MENLNYVEAIKKIILEHWQYRQQDTTVDAQIVFDEERQHYLLLHVGWEDEKRIYGCPIHVEIKEDKIWIQRDFTESGIAQELMDVGIPKDKIVLGYRSPTVRQLIASYA
ncbi:XisI protein [Roseofilum sp. Guam]|uniref:XisI protein n=1 Tax=Roseofilum sp. Guam TaxID=2821502 RepID=UPI001B2697D0|nr:XisI protein [Roseofilum sp. Guam]MBP0029473.1 XisI protein [Roseofilum sp. Guam]